MSKTLDISTAVAGNAERASKENNVMKGHKCLDVSGATGNATKEEKNVCCICGEEYEGYGNNPWPVKEGRCCNDCNNNVVIPARIINFYLSAKNAPPLKFDCGTF